MSEWEKLRDKYKIRNIMPSIADLERIFDIGDRLQDDAEKSWKDSCNSIDIITRKLGEERNKLEDIKKKWKERPSETRCETIPTMNGDRVEDIPNHEYYEEWLPEFEKLLGVEE